jgi:hypothetical protein
MTKQIEVRYLSIDTPDYFQGFGGAYVYMVPVFSKITVREVFDNLMEEIRIDEIFGFTDEDYEEIEKQAREIFIDYFDENGKPSDDMDTIFCNSLDLGREEEDEELDRYEEEEGSTWYAYFGVSVKD